MKVINNRTSFASMEMADLSRKIDHDIEDIQCFHCGGRIRLYQAYINKEQTRTFEYMLKQYNNLLNEIDEAIVSIYGEDVRKIHLINRINELRKQFLKPNLKSV